ncbi:protein SOSEKI 5-like [Phragmites australis]|uniref:protein SOSEKI 5-like n=1 Tax=Phragmites australis TaxID=29695 RepID=UPI002D7A0A0C|nr:protein SOSEKI 5-like [Phragmites australis]
MVWTEPKRSNKSRRKVAVVYYLCHRNGHLEQPHLLEMEVALSAHGAGGLYLRLRDFTARLNMVRGNAIANIYSWSSKRSYKNGFVWHDLTEDDLIHPAHGNEYVLKGSQLLHLPHQPPATCSSSSQEKETTTSSSSNWSSFDLVADGATQTEISPPPPSSSSPDTLVTLSNNDVAPQPQCEVADREVAVIAGGRMRTSSVLMQLISCGSITVKDGLHLSCHSSNKGKEVDKMSGGGMGMGMGMERDYFSGSLIETKKSSGDAALKRSSSYNAHRGTTRREVNISAVSDAVLGVGVEASR